MMSTYTLQRYVAHSVIVILIVPLHILLSAQDNGQSDHSIWPEHTPTPISRTKEEPTAIPSVKVPMIMSTDLRVGNTTRMTTTGASATTFSQLSVSHNNGSINLEYAVDSPDIALPSQIRYQLSGYDDDWIIANKTSGQISYTNIDPGAYEFRMSFLDNQGIWSDDMVLLALRVQPPFWESSVFYFGIVTTMVVLGGTGIFWYNRRLQTRGDELARNIAERTRDLSSIHETITNPSQKSFDIDLLYGRVLQNLSQSVSFSNAAILIIEGDNLSIRGFRGNHLAVKVKNWRFDDRANAIVGIFQSKQPTIVGNASTLDEDDPVRSILPPALNYRSLVCIPLTIDNRLIGGLVVTRMSENAFDKQEIRRLSIFAQNSSSSIQNIRVFQQLRQMAIIGERHRISRDLHDAVAQSLYSASLIADGLPGAWEKSPSRAQEGTEKLRELTRQALNEMRGLMLELREDTITQTSLSTQLEELINSMAIRSSIQIEQNIHVQDRLPPDLQIGIYRIAQECLNNVIKHSKAEHALVEMTSSHQGGTLRVKDNGCGFDLNNVSPERMGLIIIQERAAQINAKVNFKSQLGEGTEVVVRW